MKTLPEKLESLAGILDKKAEMYDALAVDHEMNRETGPAQYARRRAGSAREYAAVAREAAKVITGRHQTAAKRAKFVPPTLEELNEYARAKFPSWPASDELAWFNHFQSVGWKVGSGKQMIDWKAASANGYRNWLERNPQASPSSKAKDPNPPGWEAFARANGIAGTSFRLAPGWMRSDFEKTQQQ